MNADRELDVWRRQWQAHTNVPPDLRSTLERQTRMMRLRLVARVGLTVIYGVGTVLWSVTSARRDVVVLAVAIWLFIATGWTFALTNSRGTWKPAASTTAAFLDLFIIRCRRRLQAITFASVFYVVMLSFLLAWIYHDLPRRNMGGFWAFLTSGSNLVVWVVTASLGVLAVWQRRTVQRSAEQPRHAAAPARRSTRAPQGVIRRTDEVHEGLPPCVFTVCRDPQQGTVTMFLDILSAWRSLGVHGRSRASWSPRWR